MAAVLPQTIQELNCLSIIVRTGSITVLASLADQTLLRKAINAITFKTAAFRK